MNFDKTTAKERQSKRDQRQPTKSDNLQIVKTVI